MSSRLALIDGKSVVALPAYALAFLIAVFPMVPALSPLKELLFAVIITMAAVATWTTGRTGIHPIVALWTFMLSAMSFFFVMEGFFAGAPGATLTASVYVMWPIAYTLLLSGARSQQTFFHLSDVFIVSTACIGIYAIFYALTETKVLPDSRLMTFISFDWAPQHFILDDEIIHMQYPGLNTLPFLVPFVFAALVTCRPSFTKTFRRILLWTALLLGLLSAAMGGRRALFVVIFLAPVLTLFFVTFQPRDDRRSSQRDLLKVTAIGIAAAVVALGCLIATYGISFKALSDRFTAGLNFTATETDSGASYRREQFHALVGEWMEHPLLGAGHGVPAYGSRRSELSPWNYELSYFALLYQTGLLGFAVYGAGILWIYWRGIDMIRAGGPSAAIMVPCLVGMSSFLIANATNPYLAGLDGMWTIFFPLALINFWLLTHAVGSPPRWPETWD